jgi:pre-mRNA-processing factor 19
METLQLAAPPQADANGKRAAPMDTTMEEAAGGEPSKKARPALGSDVVDALTACSTELSKTRKKRVISPTVATPEEIQKFSLTGSHALHGTRKGGILSLAVSPESDTIIASGGNDTNINVFDRAAGQTVATLKGHGKKVNQVAFIGSRAHLASASSDKTVRIWKADNAGEEDSAYSCAAIFDDAGGEVISVAVHPTNNYLISAATDGVWSFYDVSRSECLARVSQDTDGGDAEGYTSAALHPDGLILCTGGAKSTVKIWETRTQKCVGKFDGHSGAINSMSFSENGYYMASAAADGVKLWDLRKLKNFQSLMPYGEAGAKTPATTSVKFDHSGLFLAVCGADARIYGVKQEWEVVKEFTDVPKKGACSLAWGTDAKSLFVGAADHNLRVFS